MTNTRDMLLDHLESTFATLELLEDAASRGSWHDEDSHDDADWCVDCDRLAREYGEHPDEALLEMPLEIVAEVGKPLSILLTFGGPNIWVEWDLSNRQPSLMGVWGGETITMSDRHEVLFRVMSWFLPEYV